MSTGKSSFWDYSLTVYEQPDVAPACLSLQNQYGFDVNLVLFCLWYGEIFAGSIPQTLLLEAMELSRYWSELSVRPLRKIRTEMKQDAQLQQLAAATAINTLREKVKSLELQAEKIQQTVLEELAYTFSSKHSDLHPDDARANHAENSRQNLMLLTAAMNLDPDDGLESLLTVLLTRCCNTPAKH